MDARASFAKSYSSTPSLCFNPSHFNRHDFDVERFINLARRRAPLDQLQQDLRTHLRFLQNSMVELINDDYADFVHLSSGLAQLKDTVDKVSTSIRSEWTEFCHSVSEIQRLADALRIVKEELNENKKKQIHSRNLLALVVSVESLAALIKEASANKRSTCNSSSVPNRTLLTHTLLLRLRRFVTDVQFWMGRVQLPKKSDPNLPIKDLTAIVQARDQCLTKLRTLVTDTLVAALLQIELPTQKERPKAIISHPSHAERAELNSILIECIQILGLVGSDSEKLAASLVSSEVVEKCILLPSATSPPFLSSVSSSSSSNLTSLHSISNNTGASDSSTQLFDDIFVSMNAVFGNAIMYRNSLSVKLEQTISTHSSFRCLSTNQSIDEVKRVQHFLDRCVLECIVSVLDKRFSSVLVPTNPTTFHRCFIIAVEFVQRWQSAMNNESGTADQQENSENTQTDSNSLLPKTDDLNLSSTSLLKLRTILDKFSLTVYFKLVTRKFLTEIESKKHPTEILFSIKTYVESDIHNSQQSNGLEISEPIPSQQQFNHKKQPLIPYSVAVLHSISEAFADEVFLVPLADRFWEFTLRCLQDYIGWIDETVSHFSDPLIHQKIAQNSTDNNVANSNTVSKPLSGPKTPPPNPNDCLLSLALLSNDICRFDSAVFDRCLLSVWPRLRSLDIDPTPFGQCLSSFSDQIAAKKRAINDSIIMALANTISNHLTSVSEIPKKYRWTKRPPPTSPSPYLKQAFDETLGCFRTAILAEEQSNTKFFGWTENELLDIVVCPSLERSVEEFCNRTEKVLDSVEQTESSMQRFKNKKNRLLAGSATSTATISVTNDNSKNTQQQQSGADSDELKIRAQIVFDVGLVRLRVLELSKGRNFSGVLLESLSRLEQRAKQPQNP